MEHIWTAQWGFNFCKNCKLGKTTATVTQPCEGIMPFKRNKICEHVWVEKNNLTICQKCKLVDSKTQQNKFTTEQQIIMFDIETAQQDIKAFKIKLAQSLCPCKIGDVAYFPKQKMEIIVEKITVPKFGGHYTIRGHDAETLENNDYIAITVDDNAEYELMPWGVTI